MSELKERTLLFKGQTTTNDDTYPESTNPFAIGNRIDTDYGAPWEIQIKSALGLNATEQAATTGDAGIEEYEAQAMGNFIHRLLKKYMATTTGNLYSKAKIQNVRLNVTLKE